VALLNGPVDTQYGLVDRLSGSFSLKPLFAANEISLLCIAGPPSDLFVPDPIEILPFFDGFWTICICYRKKVRFELGVSMKGKKPKDS
jgi:hypothetical protein